MKDNFLSKDQMEKLTTEKLLAYKTKLISYWEVPFWNDPNSCMAYLPCREAYADLKSVSKATDNSWKEAYANIKTILATRENITKE